jgi:hypothetical protein
MALVLVIILIVGTVDYMREPRPFPSPTELLPVPTRPAPELAPDRAVSEQDCGQPIDPSSGNLRCK